MPKIIPIRDLKNTTLISEMCHEKDEPIFVTKNGYDDMVIMSTKTFNKYEDNYSASYNFSVENLDMAAEPSSNYFINKKYTLNEIRRVLSPLFADNNVKSAILFGSYAKNTATEKSDIDLVVDSGLKGLKFFGLVNDISESLRVPVDVFDVREINKNSDLEKEIKNTGILIYGE